ncbi:MAG: hypothetical protein IKJ77_02735 [Firmicutes bacterium]|nr:hypothetical protein [Bacillota bacterium]
MNVIGKIGEYITIYQEPIEIAVIAVLIVGGVICIGKAIASAGRKRRMLEQISETVSEINDNVKHLNDKRTEVIYIDGRVTTEGGVPAAAAAAIVPTEAPRPAKEDTPDEKEENASEPEVEPTIKYFSRDCAVAKDGRQYTFEELNAQIRD